MRCLAQSKTLSWLLLCMLATVIVGPQPAPAATRKVLVLYKARDPNHDVHVAYLGQFIRSAGFDYESRDVEKLLQEKDANLSGYAGIVTAYLSSQMVGATEYPRFLIRQMQAGRPICIVGSYGAYQGLIPKSGGRFIEWNESTQVINTFFWPFGLEFYFGFTNQTDKFRITRKDKQFAEFEAPLEQKDVNYYQLFKSHDAANQVYLGVMRTDMKDSDSAFVVHTPFGGMILEGYGFYWSPEQKKMVQRVDMVRFIQQALDRKLGPVPTCQVLTHAELLEKNPLPQRPPPHDDTSAMPGEVSRLVLVPYKVGEAPVLEHHPLVGRCEIALNYLGVRLDFWPLETRGLPDDAQMKRYRGIITWHITPAMKNARAYGQWLLCQMDAGRKVAILQDYGASVDRLTQEKPGLEQEVFKRLGMQYRVVREPRIEHLPKIRVQDRLMGFEHPVDTDYITYSTLFRSTSSQNTVHFSYQDNDYGPVDLVVTGPAGGVALETSPFYFPPGDPHRKELVEKAIREEIQPEIAEQPTIGQWIVDPYAFFSRALDLDSLPAPDYTTLNGDRMFYTHIDGDAFDSVSLIDRAHTAGRYVLDDVLQAYPQIPHTVSVISKFVERTGNEFYNPSLELARSVFALPQVEVATHTATHPFDWVGGDPYVVNPNAYPYQIAYRPQNYVEEIWASRLFIEKNLAGGKPCDVVLWSGATNPPEKALEVAWRAGMANLNGGDPIYDAEHPSIASLAPVAQASGAFRQYFTSAQNDYIYTLFLTGDWGGQKKVLDHYAHTGEPRRILPMNLYYHYYSGIKQESLDALHYVFNHVIAEVEAGRLAPVFTSTYCRVADDFSFTRIGQDAPGRWWVKNAGHLRTLRIKRPVEIDLARSSGVLGYDHAQGQTYVHLDGSMLRRIVVSVSPPDRLFLRRGSMLVDSAAWQGPALTLRARGLGWLNFVIAGARPGAGYRITLQGDGGKAILDTASAARADGEIAIKQLLPPPSAAYTLTVTPATTGRRAEGGFR